MADRARTELDGAEHAREADLRYRGQSFELEIEWADGLRLVERFHREHEARYGYRQTAPAIEIVSARLRSTGVVENPVKRIVRGGTEGGRTVATSRSAPVHFDDGRRTIAVYAREELPAGARLKTPCVVTEYSSTTLVPAGAGAEVDARGNLVIVP